MVGFGGRVAIGALRFGRVESAIDLIVLEVKEVTGQGSRAVDTFRHPDLGVGVGRRASTSDTIAFGQERAVAVAHGIQIDEHDVLGELLSTLYRKGMGYPVSLLATLTVPCWCPAWLAV